jgi:hypothetical protein
MVKDHKILENQSIYDIANINLGGIDNIYLGLIKLNPSIPNIDFDLNTIASKTIQFDDLYYQSATLQVQLNINSQSSIISVTGLENQSIYDIALMKYGGLDNIYDLIVSNNLVSINQLDVAFKTIIFDTEKVINENITKQVASKNHVFATLLFVNEDGVIWDGVDIIWDGTDSIIY